MGAIHDAVHDVDYSLRLSKLKCGAFRIRLQPAVGERFSRFDVAAEPIVVDQQELGVLDQAVVQAGDKSVTVSFSSGGVAVVSYSPFSISLQACGRVIAVLNPKDTAVFETGGGKDVPESFGGHSDAVKNGPTGVALDFAFSSGVAFSGLAAHTLPLTLKPTTDAEPIRFFNTDINEFEVGSPMAMYGAIPFLLAHGGADVTGVFWANPSETWVDLGENTARFISEGGFIDTFVFGGTAGEVLNGYTRLTGRPQLVPGFALSFHQCRWGYMSSEEVRGVTRGLDGELVPHDVLWLDLDHTDDRKYFTWGKSFKDASHLLAELDANRRKLVTLVDPHLKAERSYSVHAEAQDKGLLLKNEHGGDFVGKCWPGQAAWPDFLNPATRQWWASQFRFDKYASSAKNLYIWNDMNEISVFEAPEGTATRDLQHFGGIEEREVHNLYGALMVRATYDGLKARSSPSLRPFILTRSFFAGSQRYATCWSGDNAAQWTHLRNSVQLVLSFGVCGMPFSGSDVGGFFDSPSEELLARWMGTGAWLYPFFRVHCHHKSKPREIHRIKDETLRRVARSAVVRRYELLPYWYTLAREAATTGAPLVRPLWWEFPTCAGHRHTDDAAMLGSALLVVPFLDEVAAPREFELPGGVWFDWHTLGSAGSGVVTLSYAEGPAVLLRGGSIVPLKTRLRKSSELMFYDPFVLVVAVAEGEARGELYVDDGQTFNYEAGEYIHKKLVFADGHLRSYEVEGRRRNAFGAVYDVTIEEIRIVGVTGITRATLGGEELQVRVDDDVTKLRRLSLKVADDFDIVLQ